MNLIKTLIFVVVVLLFDKSIELRLFEENFRSFVQNVASIYHSNWRENFLREHPFVQNRFRQTTSFEQYNSSDFIYPMIVKVGSKYSLCLVHRNLKVARVQSNDSLVYVDILNMNHQELPPDRALENEATAKIACQYVIEGLRQNRLFDQDYIDEIANIIHIQWMKRNGHHSSKDLLVPFINLTESQKNKDRRVILVACRYYNEFSLYHRFNTTPIHFTGKILS